MKQQENPPPVQPKTLQLYMPFRFSIGLTLLFLLIYLAAGEVLVRLAPVRDRLGAPSLGTEHKQFEQQWARFEIYAAGHETIDCVFLGDSTVQTDFWPGAFAEAYREESGAEIDCFNFGTGAFSVEGLATLAQILARDYSPRLIIVGVQALDFTVSHEEQGNTNLTDTSWARYRLGEFTPAGWLYDHAYLYRYLGVIRELVTLTGNLNEVMLSEAGAVGGLHDGYYPMPGPGPFDISLPPDPNIDHPYIEHYYSAIGNFQFYPENLTALDQIFAIDNSQTKVLLVEMPVPKTFYAFFNQGEQDYRNFVEIVTSRAEARNVPFWTTSDLMLPVSFWYNYNHLTPDGAERYSRWLGQELAHAPIRID
jgi:hypothetical protein